MEATNYAIHVGDCLEILRAMPEQSVNCCVTSPPYFGLRDYGVDGQIGLEQTPEQYIGKMVEVFREVRRVLRDDGTLWLNLGDSYSDVGRSHQKRAKDASGVQRPAQIKECERCGTEFEGGIGRRFCSSFCGGSDNSKREHRQGGLKAKDLIGIPWRVAFALQADGWYLRQDIIWHKPNPMPESVRDRCTKAHEYVFLLSKSPRYYFDSEAIKEPAVRAGDVPGGQGHYIQHSAGGHNKDGLAACGQKPVAEKRNRRSVWTVATRPYKGAHFATFPPALIEPCILAGCPAGGTVLDPFGGSGTTAGVALAHGRNAVLCELNPEYAELVPGRVESILASYGKAQKPKAKSKPAPADAPQVALF